MAAPTPLVNLKVEYTQIFINNEFVNSVSGKTFEVLNPANEKVLANVQEGDKADVEKAVEAANKAFKHGSEWRNTSPKQRGAYLNKLADLIERDRLTLATLESWDTGKKFLDAYGEVDAASAWLRYTAGLADKLVGHAGPVEEGFFSYTRLEPVGVCACITPWNYPMVILCQKLAPSLAAGCTVVCKPAEQTPLTSIYICKLVKEAGIPAGVVNMVSGFGETAGAALTSHMKVNKVSFTGSSEVGRLIMENAARSNLKRVTLELGGKSPNIVLSDVDLDFAVERSHSAVMMNMGQICCAGSRTYVHEDIYDEFVKRSTERAKKRVVGNPLDPAIEQGPQIDKTQFDKVLGYIESGKKEGAKLMCGGQRHGTNGYFIQPTVFSDVKNNMKIAREEIFGPVQSIFKFKTIEEAIELANDTHYGLAAAVFTKDINKALNIASRIDAGTVWVNCYNIVRPDVPFGGFKTSGVGREFGLDGIKAFCEVKSVTIDHKEA